MIKTTKKIKENEGGFGIIELLVSMFIFLIVIGMVVQIFLISLGGSKRLFGRQQALDSARYIMESMSKEIRMSEIVTTASPTGTLDIVHPINGAIRYRFSSNNLTREGDALNSDEVQISNGRFYVIVPATNSPPRVTITMTATSVGTVIQQVRVNLQTTVSSRQYAQ